MRPWTWRTLTGVFQSLPGAGTFWLYRSRRLFYRLVLPFNQNIMLWVFTNMTKPVAYVLSDQGIKTVMYLSSWLVQTPDHLQCEARMDLTLYPFQQKAFLFNLARPHLTPSQMVVWLGMEWDNRNSTLCLSQNNLHMLTKCAAPCSSRMCPGSSERICVDSFSSAMTVVLLGWICHCYLTYEGNCLFPIGDRDWLIPFPSYPSFTPLMVASCASVPGM